MFLITVLVSLAASFMPLSKLFPDYASRILFSEIILAAPGAVYLAAERQNYARAVRLKPIKLSTLFWLILFTACVMPVMSLVNAISMLFVENSAAPMMLNVTAGHSYLLSMLLIALLPCIFEESVYRGLFYNEYRKAAPIAGIILSALLFGLMHGNLNQFCYAFLMGIIFALIIEATDSILASMIMHFIINGFSTTVMSLYPKLTAYLARMYEEAKAAGDTALMERLKSFANINVEEDPFAQGLEMVSSADTLGSIIRSFLPAALIGGFFAVIIYRVIAAGEGRLDYIDRMIFKRKGKDKVSFKAEQKEIQKQGTWKDLITIPLITAIFLCFSLMILNEFL